MYSRCCWCCSRCHLDCWRRLGAAAAARTVALLLSCAARTRRGGGGVLRIEPRVRSGPRRGHCGGGGLGNRAVGRRRFGGGRRSRLSRLGRAWGDLRGRWFSRRDGGAVGRFDALRLDRARPRAAERRGAWLTDEHARDADVFGRKGQHGQLPGALEGDVQRALMRGARARLAARFDLAAFREEPPQAAEILVVDLFDLVDAELADLASGGEFSATARTEFARSAARPWARTARAAGGRSHDHSE